MRLRNVRGSREMLEASHYVIDKPEEKQGHWKDVFGNENPVRIEIGMGKGKFIIRLATENPDINYIGIEMYSSVLVRAVQRLGDEELPNLKFICMNAENLSRVFAAEEVDCIYLNFSDPWPKDRHQKRRLTSAQFMDRYHQVLKQDGVVEFKTDNKGLFEFSLLSIPEAGWIIREKTFDLHHSEMAEGNVMTEYEEKFSSQGVNICKLIACRNKKIEKGE